MANNLDELIAEEYGAQAGEKEEATPKKGKKEEKVRYIADFPELVDLVESNGTKFLTFSGQILDFVDIEGRTYLPPDKVDWLLPNAEKVLGEVDRHSATSDASGTPQGCTYCQEELYPSLYNYFEQFSDTPTEAHRHFLVWMDFHSYLIEKFNFSPLLFLVATKDRGKTPTLKSLAYSSYRGIFTETFREPNLIRYSSDYKASIFFDVRDFPKKVEKAGSEDLIFGRAERGVKASRVLFPERGAFRDMVSFEVFGVTGATSNVMVDAITEARCIVFNMPFSKKVFNVEATPQIGLPIRERLTAFRMAHHNTPFVEVRKERPGKLENYLRGYNQMIKTIFPKYIDIFNKFKSYTVSQKKEEAESTLEGKLLSAVIALKEQVTPGTLFLSTEDIVNKINEGRPERFFYGVDTIGSALRGIGFKMKRDPLGVKRGIFYDIDLIVTLGDQFNIDVKDMGVHARTQEGASDVSDSYEQTQSNDIIEFEQKLLEMGGENSENS